METNNVNIFVNSICDNIKYSPIKEDLKKELYEHIIEEKNNYIQEGFDSKEAETKAIYNMGEPKQISRAFNKVYKKKIDWKMLFTFLLLMLINILLIFTIASNEENNTQYLIRNIVYIIVGAILSIIIYVTDYKKIQKFSLRNRNNRNVMYNT